MRNLKEVYYSNRHKIDSARQRINPKGLAFSGAAATLSLPVMPPVEWSLTYTIHELSKEVSPDLLKFAAIGLLGLANIASLALETKALQKDNYSASPISTLTNLVIGKAFPSSLFGHLANYVQLQVLNPVNTAAFISGDQRLLAESEAATALVFTGWNAGLNSLILTSSPFMETVIRAENAVRRRFRSNV